MSMSSIKPLGGRVLVRRKTASKTKGGIILPDSAQEKPREGEVVAIGTGKIADNGVREDVMLNLGDRVIFSSYAGTEVDIEDEDAEYFIMNEEEILGVVEE